MIATIPTVARVVYIKKIDNNHNHNNKEPFLCWKFSDTNTCNHVTWAGTHRKSHERCRLWIFKMGDKPWEVLFFYPMFYISLGLCRFQFIITLKGPFFKNKDVLSWKFSNTHYHISKIRTRKFAFGEPQWEEKKTLGRPI